MTAAARPLVSSDPIALCAESIRTHSKSFAFASTLLPKGCRDDAVVLYAYCRYVDDAIDDLAPEAQPAALAALETELEAVYAGEDLGHPVLRAFGELVRKRGIPQVYPRELLAGMAMDVRGEVYDSDRTLGLYCYRVASTVGLMMCHIMGIRTEGALVRAAHLGLAMQLTNICRDVAEDWTMGRLYLTQERLRMLPQGLEPPQGPGEELPTPLGPVLAPVVKGVLGWAEAAYESSMTGLMDLPFRPAISIAVARLVYGDIGWIIAARSYDVTRGRAYTSKSRKLFNAVRALVWVTVSLPRRAVLMARGRGRFAPPQTVLTFEDLWTAPETKALSS